MHKGVIPFLLGLMIGDRLASPLVHAGWVLLVVASFFLGRHYHV